MSFIGRSEALINGIPEDLRKLKVSGVESTNIFPDGTRRLSAFTFCTRQECGGERIKSEVQHVPGLKIINEDNIYCDRCPHSSA